MTTVLYILLALVAFGAMILIHELGHFLVARACGVRIEEFSIGMGPRLFGRTAKSGTTYNLRLFPVGGYVSMKGEDEDAEGEDAFNHKKPWQKFLIVAAGAAMNVLLAVIIMFFLVLSNPIASTVVHSFNADATSNAWLMPGDRIVSVDGVRVHTGNEVQYEVLHSGYEPIDLTVVRDGEEITLSGVVFPTQEESGMVFGMLDLVFYAQKKTFTSVLSQAFYRSLSTVKMTWDSLLDLIFGRIGAEAVSGPVGVTVAIGDAAKAGAGMFFYLLCVLSMNLGVFNLLPLPALDGGRLVFILFEMLFRRKVPAKYEAAVHFVGIVLLLGLMVLITFKDIVGLFQ